MTDADRWKDAAAARLPELIDLRRAIHAEPELGLHTPLTRDKVKAALAGLPLELREGPSTTGLMAVLRGGGGNGRTVLLRGDMDALPMTEATGLPFSSTIDGRMHACGHDMHTAMLAGAAKVLCDARDELPGTVVFMFQPGEEGHHGAREMIADGLLDDPKPDAAFALHVSPNMESGVFVCRPGPMLAAADTLHVTVRGRGGHASQPHDAADPVPVACEIVLALQTLVTRSVPVADPAVITVAKIEAGSAHNVIPAEVKLLGTIRSLSARTREKVLADVQRLVAGIAAAHGLEGMAEIERGYPVTVNDPAAFALTREVAGELAGERGFRVLSAPMMGAEDFSYVLQRTPGAMTFLGAAVPGSDVRTNAPLHAVTMMLDEEAMTSGVALHCALAARFLQEGLPA